MVGRLRSQRITKNNRIDKYNYDKYHYPKFQNWNSERYIIRLTANLQKYIAIGK